MLSLKHPIFSHSRLHVLNWFWPVINGAIFDWNSELTFDNRNIALIGVITGSLWSISYPLMQQYVMQITMKICTKEILVLIPFCMFFPAWWLSSVWAAVTRDFNFDFPINFSKFRKDHACYDYIHYCLELSLEVLNTNVNQFNFLFKKNQSIKCLLTHVLLKKQHRVITSDIFVLLFSFIWRFNHHVHLRGIA